MAVEECGVSVFEVGVTVAAALGVTEAFFIINRPNGRCFKVKGIKQRLNNRNRKKYTFNRFNRSYLVTVFIKVFFS